LLFHHSRFKIKLLKSFKFCQKKTHNERLFLFLSFFSVLFCLVFLMGIQFHSSVEFDFRIIWKKRKNWNKNSSIKMFNFDCEIWYRGLNKKKYCANLFFNNSIFNDYIRLYGKFIGKCSTARIGTAQKLVFQANLQIRSLVFDNFQKKKN
jgi:hypothetical protein